MASTFRSLLLTLMALLGAIALHGMLFLPAQSVPEHLIVSGDSFSFANRVVEIEQNWKKQYTDYFGSDTADLPLTATEIIETLDRLNSETQTHFALIYICPLPNGLELVAITPNQDIVRLTFPNVPKSVIAPVMDDLRVQVSRPVTTGRSLESAQQLYSWIISPLEPYLANWDVDTLIFCVGAGVRSLPIAALHDGQQFLVEKYGVSIIPAFSLTNHDYAQLSRAQVLAMGASQFQTFNALPAVPVELTAITQDLWNGDVFLNEQFTQDNLQQQLDSGKHAIVHLATHAAFQPGDPSESYIQLWNDEQINLTNLADMGWRDRPVELLVLSACQTALGDPEVELGFAGLSYHAGVKSTLASLWQVSDVGTLALMHEFYWQLARPDVTTKAEALRRTQRSMLQGTVNLAGGYLYTSGGRFALPDNLNESAQDVLSQPYYWAGFTLVGSPW